MIQVPECIQYKVGNTQWALPFPDTGSEKDVMDYIKLCIDLGLINT